MADILREWLTRDFRMQMKEITRAIIDNEFTYWYQGNQYLLKCIGICRSKKDCWTFLGGNLDIMGKNRFYLEDGKLCLSDHPVGIPLTVDQFIGAHVRLIQQTQKISLGRSKFKHQSEEVIILSAEEFTRLILLNPAFNR
jgi:hypothetical protein